MIVDAMHQLIVNLFTNKVQYVCQLPPRTTDAQTTYSTFKNLPLSLLMKENSVFKTVCISVFEYNITTIGNILRQKHQLQLLATSIEGFLIYNNSSIDFANKGKNVLCSKYSKLQVAKVSFEETKNYFTCLAENCYLSNFPFGAMVNK